jgi:hypothetical protein
MPYIIHTIPKYSKGKRVGIRVLEEPDTELKTKQKRITKELQALIEFPACVNGIRKTNTVSNSSPHTNKRVIYQVDLKDYFHTVTEARVLTSLVPYTYVINSSDVIYEGRLPTGAPTSPILANLVFIEADRAIIELIGGRAISYTRYMDDLTFSADSLSILDSGFCGNIRKIILDAGFTINYKKSGIRLNFQQQKVTGIVVNKKLNLSKYERNLLRAKLDKNARSEIPILSPELSGELAYIHGINPELAEKFKGYYARRYSYYHH